MVRHWRISVTLQHCIRLDRGGVSDGHSGTADRISHGNTGSSSSSSSSQQATATHVGQLGSTLMGIEPLRPSVPAKPCSTVLQAPSPQQLNKPGPIHEVHTAPASHTLSQRSRPTTSSSHLRCPALVNPCPWRDAGLQPRRVPGHGVPGVGDPHAGTTHRAAVGNRWVWHRTRRV